MTDAAASRTSADSLSAGLDAFAVQFEAQVSNAGRPESEHAVHFCLALGIQAAYGLLPGAIVFERRAGSRRIDLWICPDRFGYRGQVSPPDPQRQKSVGDPTVRRAIGRFQ